MQLEEPGFGINEVSNAASQMQHGRNKHDVSF